VHATIEKTASRPSVRRINPRWRVVDILVASVLGVAGALIFFAWNAVEPGPTGVLTLALPGSQSLLYGIWLFAGVLGGIVIRKPGAALFTELVAAIISALLGAQWGFATIESGLVQGLGAELVFLILFYSVWRAWVAVLAGAASGLAMAINDLVTYYSGAAPLFATAYTIGALISGAVIAGLGSWLIMRGLAKTGVLSRFAAGRTV